MSTVIVAAAAPHLAVSSSTQPSHSCPGRPLGKPLTPQLRAEGPPWPDALFEINPSLHLEHNRLICATQPLLKPLFLPGRPFLQSLLGEADQHWYFEPELEHHFPSGAFGFSCLPLPFVRSPAPVSCQWTNKPLLTPTMDCGLLQVWGLFLFFFLTAPCGMWDLSSSYGWNPGPLHWEHRVSATGPPGQSSFLLIFFSLIPNPVSGLPRKQLVFWAAPPPSDHRFWPIGVPCIGQSNWFRGAPDISQSESFLGSVQVEVDRTHVLEGYRSPAAGSCFPSHGKGWSAAAGGRAAWWRPAGEGGQTVPHTSRPQSSSLKAL